MLNGFTSVGYIAVVVLLFAALAGIIHRRWVDGWFEHLWITYARSRFCPFRSIKAKYSVFADPYTGTTHLSIQ